MADGPEVPGDWDLSGSGEPPAALLRRAISHVESLLHRLDPVETVDPAAAEVRPPAAAPAPAPSFAPASPPPILLADDAKTSTAQADALRISLRAHERAHRLRAEASGAQADAAAEGERILVETRELTERLQADARDSVAELIGVARREAAVVIDAARSEADRIRQASRVDDDHRRAEFEQAVERDRAMAADAVRGLLDEAARDADRILEQARQRGRAEAAKVIDLEVAAAVAEARDSIKASRQRAVDLLTNAHSTVDEVRATMRRLIDTLNESLTSLDVSTSSIESLLASVHAHSEPTAPPPSARPASQPAAPPAPEPVPSVAHQFTAEQRTVADRWAAERERRPLGVLFGTQGG